jgi:hypothetical protein
MNARRISRSTPSRTIGALGLAVLVGVVGLAACGGDDDTITDPASAFTTTTGEVGGGASTSTPPSTSGPDNLPPEAGGEGVMPNDATGVGPVDNDHPCGPLSVDQVAEVAPEVTGAETDGTCYYVDAAGNDVVGVSVDVGASDAGAGDEMVIIAEHFEPAFDATRAGCEPTDVEGAGEALWCTRTDPSDSPSLALRSGPTTVVLEGFGLGDRSSLTTLAEQAATRL